MDGMTSENQQIFVLGATNRPDRSLEFLNIGT